MPNHSFPFPQVKNKPYKCGKYAFTLEQGAGYEQLLLPVIVLAARQQR
jgi:hypothetical protein